VTTVLLVLGTVVVLVLGLGLWLVFRAYAGGRRAYAALLDRIEPVMRSLQAGEDPHPGHLERFAADRGTRKVLYEALVHHEKQSLFPAAHLTQESMAEADLAAWLNHPNELGALPDEIELMATLPSPGDETRRYFVFRFRMNDPHWAAKDGWLAGVAGPYPAAGPVEVSGAGTFSRFQPWESQTPEEHLRAVHELVVKRG
jgi:diadenosine tetraphosphatase ApaH/serine/threonine PP2A family protein phosphatase